MVTTNDKLEFIYAMAKHSTVTLADCKRILRYAATHQRLMEAQCNRILSPAEVTKLNRIQAHIRRIVMMIPPSGSTENKVRFSGDPRGCTVKIVVLDGYTNDWGKEGICVPA